MNQEKEHEHIWTRRREGSWCIECGETRFGVELNEEELKKLKEIKDEQTKRN